METLYEFYSQTVLNPVSFDEFITKNPNKLRQAYQVGIVAPIDQLALIDYFHTPECDYDIGFENGIKVAVGIMVGKKVELTKPEPVEPEKKAKKKAKKKKE